MRLHAEPVDDRLDVGAVRRGKWKSGASVAAAFTERESGCSSSVARSARSAYSPGAVSTAMRAQVNAVGASGTAGMSERCVQ